MSLGKPHSLAELFENQAAQTPEAIAVWHAGMELTYGELDKRANQLAHHLQALGVRLDEPVGLCLSRSFDMMVGVLAILKAGGAYLPLDPAYPTDRLAMMVSNAGAKIILTQSRLWDELPLARSTAVAPQTVLPLDTSWPLIAQNPSHKPAVMLSPDNLLYVIYTSGSTGLPKGVAMPHGPLLNLMQWQAQTSVIQEPARTLQFSPISFDVSCQELFFTWYTGGTLVLVDEITRRDAWALLAFLRQTAVHRLFLPFVALQNLTEAALSAPELPTSLREIITAGEQLQITPHLIAFFEALGTCTLHNHYGPTESHVATAYTLTGSPKQWPAIPPIGRPIANATIDILDPQTLQPVPAGESGEIYIGGGILAREYINQPQRTAERFIYLPDGRRVYKTGDLAQYGPDGEILYLGRNDFQVKVRGFRIELGEIEVLLNQLTAVRQAIVVAHEGKQGAKRLIAYLTLRTAISETEMRQALAAHLPDYMVPERFIVLDNFPLTPSGKIDRRALPTPDERPLPLGENFLPPRTATETILAEIWTAVLHIEPIGVFDHFFTIGGHSLQASQCVRRMSEQFGQRISLQTLYTAPTIAELAAWLEEQQASTAPAEETHGTTPLPPHLDALPEAWAESLAQQNQTLHQTLAAAPVVDQYAGGVHQRWYLKEGFRMAVMVTVDLSNVAEEERWVTAVTHLIHNQPVLRSHLEGNAVEARFIEFAPVTLASLPLLDLSTYDLAAQEQASHLAHTWLEQKVLQSPLTGQILFHLAVLRLHPHGYRVLMGLDHAIADHDCTWLVIRHLRQGVASPLGPRNKPPITFKEFLQATAPSSQPEQIAAFKQHVLFRAYMAEVRHLQTRYPMGKPILFSEPYLLELTAVPPTLTPIELALQLAVLLCQQLFEIESVPLRILTNRRRFGGRHYDDVLGDFHDSLPVLFSSVQTSAFQCYAYLRQVESQLSSDEIYPSGMGVDEEIYRHFFMSPFNFNYIGEMTASEEAAYLATVKPLGFVSYPLLAYVCGARVCLVLLHGLANDKRAVFEEILKGIPAEFELKSLAVERQKEKQDNE